MIDRSLLLHLWLKKLKFFYVSYKYKHLKLQLFVFKLCFCWSSILCLETRLHELQNKWSPNSSDSFFHSWLSFGSRSIIWGYSCCQKFSLPPVSVPWAAEPVGGVCLGFVWCRSRVGFFWYFSFPIWFYEGSNISTETWRKGAHRMYVREVELDMVVSAGHCLLGVDYKRQARKTWDC